MKFSPSNNKRIFCQVLHPVSSKTLSNPQLIPFPCFSFEKVQVYYKINKYKAISLKFMEMKLKYKCVFSVNFWRTPYLLKPLAEENKTK